MFFYVTIELDLFMILLYVLKLKLHYYKFWASYILIYQIKGETITLLFLSDVIPGQRLDISCMLLTIIFMS